MEIKKGTPQPLATFSIASLGESNWCVTRPQEGHRDPSIIVTRPITGITFWRTMSGETPYYGKRGGANAGAIDMVNGMANHAPQTQPISDNHRKSHQVAFVITKTSVPAAVGNNCRLGL